MCSFEGFDIVYSFDKVTIEPHFCRIYEDCGGGTSFEEAIRAVVDWHKEQIEKLKKCKNYDEYYLI